MLALCGGLIYLAIKYWPITLALVCIGAVVYAIASYEPKPDLRRAVQSAGEKGRRQVKEAGRAYRERVRNLDD